MRYAELYCKTNYSFLQSASHPEEMVQQAAKMNYQALAITDECSLAGVVKAYAEAQRHDIQLIIGSSFVIPTIGEIVVYATNLRAYKALSSVISIARRRAEKGHYTLKLKDLKACTDCVALWLPIYQAPDNPTIGFELSSYFKQLYIGVSQLKHSNDAQILQYNFMLAESLQLPLAACGLVCMHIPERKPLLDVVTAIRYNRSVDQATEYLQSNAEQHLRSLDTLQYHFAKPLLAATCELAEQCHFCLSELRYQYPKELVPSHYKASDYLRFLVEDGAAKRWPNGVSASNREQIETELKLIQELAYEYYFLTVYDIVLFAKNNRILCQGRGSAANSIICYCLFITEVSPEHTQLLFERFISKERNEPPDIDVDFEHERREEVIQYIYKKYGRHRAALAATVITYRTRSAIRDVGKALNLDPIFIDQLVKSLAWWDRLEDLKQKFSEHRQDSHSTASRFMLLVKDIMGFPRHLSQHVGGFIISEGPISELVPIENAAMQDRTIIQWDKTDIEVLGLLKVDVLALGMLSALRKGFDLIQQHYQKTVNLDSLPKEDTATYNMLCQGDSLGVFQVESRAQMAMLPRLRPRTYYDLVIEVAIVRPGPIQGDMVHPYLRRREGSEAITYPNSDIQAVLERTLGVPIFQEQVIKLAMVAAGFSGGEADQLRRAMASWGKNGNLKRFEQKLLNGMAERGYSNDFAERLFRQMQGFGEYGFPESHAASFALLVYASAWLKCHYPAAFYCALLNSQPMGFYSPSQITQDAKRHGIPILPVDIHHSQWDHQLVQQIDTSQHAITLRLGFRLVKGLSFDSASSLISARDVRHFSHLKDLEQRAKLSQDQLNALINANACRDLAQHRRQAHWQHLAIEPEKPLLSDIEADQHFALDDNTQLPAPTAFDNMISDYNTTGLSLDQHPIALVRGLWPIQRCLTASQLNSNGNKRFVRVAGIVTGRQRPGTASGVIFLTLEDETGNSNIVVWKNTQQVFKHALLKAKLLVVTGTTETKNEVTHVIAGKIEDFSHLLAEAQLKSRDFH